ncbi:MAG TPA: SDR family NAD(P)-dependent oxidoreductase [Bryobacteraceae bacterium]|nr:SDR family NAD(P)-dependent oxidoreductase [Bryobacteraceae bacterium]
MTDKVVCITGASRGIGRAAAEAFAEQGARLLLLARSEDVVRVADDLRSQTEVSAHRCDVADSIQVESAIDAAVRKWGRVDVLINAAAILGPAGDMWTTSPDEWFDTVRVNLFGTYNTMRAVLPHMIRNNSGKIMNFAGGGAAYGYPRFTAYAASKVAVVRISETVAQECAGYNIQVNSIAPGAIDTEMLRAVRAAGGEVRSVGTMDQPVALLLFLASTQSDHITGRFIHAKDSYQEFLADLPADTYTLRRVQP